MIPGSIAYGENDSNETGNIQDRVLSFLHETLANRQSRTPWISEADAILEWVGEKVHATGSMGQCTLFAPAFMDGQAPKPKFPFFRPVSFPEYSLLCETEENSFTLRPPTKDSSISIEREWNQPMLIQVNQGAVSIMSDALSLRLRYVGGEALLASQKPVEIVIIRSKDLLSINLVRGKCDLVSIKRIPSHAAMVTTRLTAAPSTTWTLSNGKLLQENEMVDILPSGFENWIKAPKQPPPQH